MIAYIKQSLPARIALFIVIFTLIAGMSFYAGVRREGGTFPLAVPTTETYASPAMGIAFEYSSELGEIREEAQELGECDDSLLTASDGCEHRYLGTTRANEPRWFFSAESRLFSLHPLPRERRYEDTFSEKDIEDFCAHGPLPLSCAKMTNEHGLEYVKVGYSPACNGFEVCSDQVFFINFIETKNPDYPVVVVWYDRSGKSEIPDEYIDQIVTSMRLQDTAQ